MNWEQIGSPQIHIQTKYFLIFYIFEKSAHESNQKHIQIGYKWVRYGSDSWISNNGKKFGESKKLYDDK